MVEIADAAENRQTPSHEKASGVPTRKRTAMQSVIGTRKGLTARRLRIEVLTVQDMGRQIGSRKSGTRRAAGQAVAAKMAPSLGRAVLRDDIRAAEQYERIIRT
jgi:hypothetical protein